jgi:hypothetical protein
MMVISEIYHSEIEQAEKEKERQVLNDRYAGFVEAENTLKLEGAKELAQLVMKKDPFYSVEINETLSELKKELKGD